MVVSLFTVVVVLLSIVIVVSLSIVVVLLYLCLSFIIVFNHYISCGCFLLFHIAIEC